MGKLRDKPFLSIDFYDENISNAIEAIYKKLRQFPKLRGPTVISKVLHLLNPEIFVMWDANIRKVYHKKNRLVNDTDKGYLEFLKESQNEIKEAISDFQRESGKTIDEVEQEIRSKFDNKTLARIVDEYNYITYTLSPNEANKVLELKIVTESMSATHMIPDPNKPLTEYICNPKHFIYATKCMILLKSFPRLNVQKVACHGRKPHTYTCWYVFFENKKILNFTIKKSNVDIEFRQLQHTPDLIGVWHWVNPNKMKGIYYNDYPERELKKILSAYLKNIKVDLKEK
ncbi:hypothetical protein D4R42_05335 [bacterium]|nr:MAG: hypothetical protein D4R42_05335 [bacterium]